jgi:adhesin/invasin
MLIRLMIPRLSARFRPSRAFPLLHVLTAALLPLAAACDKVPLLAPSGSTITISAAASALPINGTTEVSAYVVEAAGTAPQNGTLVTFSTTLGTLEPAQVRTSNGRAVTTFRAGTTSGEATIIAASGGAAVAAADGVKIQIGAAAVGQITVSANPGTVAASGGTSTIVATITDASGNILPGVPVSFSTDAGSLSSALVTTNQYGQAQTTLTTARDATVTATAGSSSGGSAPSGKVTVSVNTTVALTVTAPSGTLTTGQVITLTISRASGGSPIQSTTVSWGDGAVQTYSGLPATASHTYSVAGAYGIVVTATDTFGDVSTGSASVTITAKPGPTLSGLAATLTSGTTYSFAVTITPATGTTITSTTWTFGDGSTTTLPGATLGASHTYAGSGNYSVSVTATDTNGQSASISMILNVP